jgi:hypothetical protein
MMLTRALLGVVVLAALPTWALGERALGTEDRGHRSIQWRLDYGLAMREAQLSGRMMFLVFSDPGSPAAAAAIQTYRWLGAGLPTPPKRATAGLPASVEG